MLINSFRLPLTSESSLASPESNFVINIAVTSSNLKYCNASFFHGSQMVYLCGHDTSTFRPVYRVWTLSPCGFHMGLTLILPIPAIRLKRYNSNRRTILHLCQATFRSLSTKGNIDSRECRFYHQYHYLFAIPFRCVIAGYCGTVKMKRSMNIGWS